MKQISDDKKTLDTERDQAAHEIGEAPNAPNHASPQESPPAGPQSQTMTKKPSAMDQPDPPSPTAKRTFLDRARYVGGLVCKIILHLRISLTSLFVCLILAAILLVVYETFQYRVTVKPIMVPPEIANMGYTPRVAAQQLTAHIHDISNPIKTAITIKTAINNPNSERFRSLAGGPMKDIGSDVDFVLPVVGLSIKPTAEYLRNLLELKVTVVTGEILYDDLRHESISLHLRINGERVANISGKDNQTKIGQLFWKGAYEVIKNIEPHRLPSYHYFKGNALANTGDDAGAIGNFEKATKLDPTFAPAYNNWGVVLANTGDDAGAIGNFEKATKLDPTFAPAYNNWGVVLANTGDDAGAIEKYKKATELNPQDAPVYNNWGNALANTGDYAGAIEKYKKATKLDPTFALAYHNWGLALANTGDDAGAIGKYKKATELNPQDAVTYRNWGVVLANTGDDAGAIEKYKKATELNPQDAVTYRNWGVVLADKRNYAGAIEKYKKATELNPQDAPVYNNWGNALASTGDDAGAIEKYKKATELNPQDAVTYRNWGVVLANTGDDAGAIEKYKKATELNPQDAVTYRNWGEVLANMGDCDGSIGKYKKATELDGKPSRPALEDMCPR